MTTFRCECGTTKVILEKHVKSSLTQSCGCIHSEQLAKRNAENSTHGMTRTPEYRVYLNAMQRCTNPNHKSFSDYGGRGIEFRFTTFEDFFEEAGKRPGSGFYIDRKDNNRHYEPGNLRWVTVAESNRNRRNVRATV